MGRFYAKKSPEIATRKVQRRGLSKAQISGNTMSIGLKELRVDRGELSSTFFCVSSSLIVCGVITPKATISNISCSEFHLSRSEEAEEGRKESN